VADPWILGLYGLAGATFVVAAHLTGWYGGGGSGAYAAPFAAVFGGVAQLLAAMWAYRVRDGLGTAMLGTWGAFWIAYGILNALFVTGRLVEPPGAFPELGFWFIPLAAITWVGVVAADARSSALAAVLVTLAAGSTIAVFAETIGSGRLTVLSGWLFIVSAACAWYTASALMLEDAFGRQVFPLGRSRTIAEPARTEAPEPGPLGQVRRAG
jgi:succinate-acetate transporter protein